MFKEIDYIKDCSIVLFDGSNEQIFDYEFYYKRCPSDIMEVNMRKNRNKNYTFYWITGISTTLTIPISIIIVNKIQAGNVAKAVMIMVVFLVLLTAILLLYKYTFGVTVQEITQEDRVTELDRLYYTLAEYRKKYSNNEIRRCIDMVNEQIQRFKRRKNVMFQVADESYSSKDNGALGELVQTVEDAIVINTERLVN